MKTDIKDFIGVVEGAVPDALCDDLIAFFEHACASGFAWNRQVAEGVPKISKNDDTLYMAGMHTYNLAHYLDTKNVLDLLWQNIYMPYARTYDVLSTHSQHAIYGAKLQRTQVGGGYHVWHCENSTRETSHRLFAFTLYLNDVEEGGETEFLYYPRRVRPKKGTGLVFPASFTHTHRGNPPISGVKYILTGWIEF